jgi:hypothetical protein
MTFGNDARLGLPVAGQHDQVIDDILRKIGVGVSLSDAIDVMPDACHNRGGVAEGPRHR